MSGYTLHSEAFNDLDEHPPTLSSTTPTPTG